jgi:hypothetical protein
MPEHRFAIGKYRTSTGKRISVSEALIRNRKASTRPMASACTIGGHPFSEPALNLPDASLHLGQGI